MTFNDRSSRGLYRARDGLFAGVCKGVADYFDFSVVWMRILVVIAFLFTGFWPVAIVYVVAAMIMKLEPVVPPQNAEETEFYNSYAASRQMALRRLQTSFEKLDRRLQRMEDIVTDPEYEWERRLNNT